MACTENKSVISNLNENQVLNLLSKDSLYEEIIEDAQYVRKRIDDDIVGQAKFKKLSYKDYLQYYKLTKDNKYYDQFEEDAKVIYNSESKKTLDKYIPKIDSMMARYKFLREENSASSQFYVKYIDLAKVENETEPPDWYIVFIITPIKGHIDFGQFDYEVKNRENKIVCKAKGTFDNISTQSELSYRFPNELKYELIDSNTNNLKYTGDEISSNYTLKIKPSYVQKGDKIWWGFSTNTYVPYEFKKWIDEEYLQDRHYELIISDYFKIFYRTEWSIQRDLREKDLMKNHPLAYEFDNY